MFFEIIFSQNRCVRFKGNIRGTFVARVPLRTPLSSQFGFSEILI